MTPAAVLSLCRFPVAIEARPVSDSDPSRTVDVLITPSPTEYEQLSRDLATLRDAGAESNTRAILDAVHDKAEATDRVPSTTEENPA